MMYALTLHQPWAWAIPLFKDVENRKWPPPDALVGQQIAIHAAKRYSYEEEVAVLQEWRRFETLPPIIHLDDMPRGAITAITTLIGWMELNDEKTVVRIGRSFRQERWLYFQIRESNHAFGPFCWLLDKRIQLPMPIPCRGWQRLWHLPWVIEEAVRAQLRLQNRGCNLICPICYGAGWLVPDPQPGRRERLVQSTPMMKVRCRECGGTGIKPTTQAKGA